ncbi:helix-turn-helix domain-containing protein [Paenibacillus barcinonensis]|uniref:AraC-like protein n=1 Tax=Paenibacillus barcinonensis TaxID=198119 RepID=A0A2V4UU10_PAEBA|nr:helix-turn-helix domain-containing protein [Paenibacillus barcinonensis]PYE42669.1 AraC-like protein [Paenibacillus barcinonensis]QKS58890.1 helix-turn-helix domain-containing protein [Paenibacillus barcinonensis]
MNESYPQLTETSSLPLLSSMCRVRRRRHFRVQGMTVTRPILCLILQGKGLLALDDIVHEAQAGEIFMIKPGITIEAVSHSEMTEFLILRMEHMHMKRVRGQWKMTPAPSLPSDWQTGKIRIRNEQQAALRMSRLFDSYRGEHADHFISIHSQLHELLHFLSEHRLEANLEKVDPAVERSIIYMRRFMSEGISMDQLAKIAGLTPSSYSRSFKKAKGMSPTDYLNQLRIEEAKKQLTKDHCVLKDVAESLGYGNEYYFSRKFKQLLGIAPSIYMKKHRLRVATVSSIGLDEQLCSLGLQPVEALDMSFNANINQSITATAAKTVAQTSIITNMLDRLRRAKPDLIIGDASCELYNDHLKNIAPVVIIEATADWKQTFLRLAELTGREPQAKLYLKQMALQRLEAGVSHTSHQERKHTAWAEQANTRAAACALPPRGNTAWMPSRRILKGNPVEPVVARSSVHVKQSTLRVIGQ